MTTTKLLAFHGKPRIKKKYLARVAAHRQADELLQGFGYWQDGRGCAVGSQLTMGEYDEDLYRQRTKHLELREEE